MQRDERNPFIDETLDGLNKACSAMVSELEQRTTRSAAARADLADRVRYLLLVLAERIATGSFTPKQPENTLRNDNVVSLAEVFADWNDSETHTAAWNQRKRTLQRAANYVLGPDAWRWLNPGAGTLDSRPCYRGVSSDEGLKQCLRELEAMHKAQ